MSKSRFREEEKVGGFREFLVYKEFREFILRSLFFFLRVRVWDGIR